MAQYDPKKIEPGKSEKKLEISAGVVKSRERIEEELDRALADTFPASDPVSMEIPTRGDRSRKARAAVASNS